MEDKKKNPAHDRAETRDKLTLRISTELNYRTKEKAEYLGISQNAFINVLIGIGLKWYDANPSRYEMG